MPAIHVSVLAAFLDTGSLNACTPLAIASTPVMAVQPDAKARRNRKSESVPRPAISTCDDGTLIAEVPLVTTTNMPYTTVSAIREMNAYVGTENTAPDSLTPLRLPIARTATKNSAIGTVQTRRLGNADVIAAVPAATDTATVST